MSPAFESFLARIYTDSQLRRRFLEDPEGEAVRAGLNSVERAALARIDREGLELAAFTFERKRMHKAVRRKRG